MARQIRSSVVVSKKELREAIQTAVGYDIGNQTIEGVSQVWPENMELVEIHLMDLEFSKERQAAQEELNKTSTGTSFPSTQPCSPGSLA